MAAPRPARPKPLDWSPPSHLTVFIRNLKLLQLDQREDWPDITLRTLSPSSQNQRQRTRLVEWALYYLFTIWDPDSAQNKLRPFFPPLEPLQSVNLRAALFRALTELKKNGDLGRETILCKTMLDDCKGEKFDELLAVFSTAVLRKLVAASASDMLWNPAMRISTVSSISAVEYQNIFPLILAHQVSLSAAGGRRAGARETYDQFSRLLDDKKIELAERADHGIDHANDLPQIDSETLTHEIRSNWLGSQEWATALLDGGAQSSTDAFLELPFSQAWARAKESSVDDLGVGLGQDLVIDLESRVLRLQTRLRRWREYNDLLRKKRHESGDLRSTESQGPRLLFRDHQALTVASISKAVRQPAGSGRALNDADQDFMSTVNEAIARVNGQTQASLGRTPETTSPNVFPASAAPMDESPSSMPPGEESLVKISEAFSPQITLSHHEENIPSSPPVAHFSPDQRSEVGSEPDPEPSKMAASTSNYTLAERTRKSMSLIPPLPSHEAPSQPRSRRGPRPSFPVNQFETPRKTSARSASGRSGASTPQDRLFEEDVEYASVFKSRPRVAHSPISSPAVHFSPSLEDEEFELDDSVDSREVDSPMPASRLRR
ncbi:hypothetical protein N7492_005340 [Penicillium capsulatum]|uniref:HAUS augmin-like complex subunit 6 N-terminal domain-containing protein n=1 Tax=Penicillium capsulatum TaxID=69766 RepID=A0A9W9ID85_9EURO|nr:hypothetical protein N7492_005340 [Penicillium capsulatum]KAJ6135560.1 hypothetical protein N7512_000720 [Penicillium capsulatum]